MLDTDALSHFIEENQLIKKGDRIVLGVSGGADSICLLHILSCIQKALEIRLFVVHINHGIRGEEAKRDEDFVRDFCKRLNVEFFAFHYDIKKMAREQKISEEEAGRKARYSTFDTVAKKIIQKEGVDAQNVKIAIAHNKDDNAETILHNLSRGSGISGLKGILAQNGNIIRPLLCFSRQEIEEYLSKNNIEYMTDSTNLENEYTRNILRNEVFPILKNNVNSNVINNFYKTSNIVAEADEYFENLAIKFCEKNLKNTGDGVFLLNKKELLKKEHILATYIIRYSLREILKQKNHGIKDIAMVHIEDIWNLAKLENGKKLDLKYSLKVYNEYDNLKFSEEAVKTDNIILPEIKYRILDDFNMKDIPKDGNIRWMDFDKVLENIVKYNRKSLSINNIINKDDMIKIIKENLVIRGYKSGDFIYIRAGKKAIKKLFTDEKIPATVRKDHILLSIDSQVLWIFSLDNIFYNSGGLDRTGELYRVDKNTKNILEIKVSRRLI